MLLGRVMGFKAGPGFELLLWTLLEMCDSGETRGSLYTTGSGVMRGERDLWGEWGAGGGLALGEVTGGGRIR